jgi:L-alanine-DL-glutamate epimerase-like enolase superfamily enzyme
MVRGASEPAVDAVDVAAFTVPTDRPESDGTLAWSSTTLVLAEARAGDCRGLGFTYAPKAVAGLIGDVLRSAVVGRSAMDVEAGWEAMAVAVRNCGHPGLSAMAISAVDVALWDLKARLLQVPLIALFGAVRESVAVYGSGGFTSYSVAELQEQLGGWTAAGIGAVKMKVGRDPGADAERVRAARAAIGAAQLFVDANGAYDRKQALLKAEQYDACGVSWFEEPVSSDDLDGLRLLRDRAPVRMDIAAGEYGYDLPYFRRMLDAGAVDVLQADATRCGGFTGFRRAAALCRARSLPLSAHTAPTLHAHVGCAEVPLRHVEYFHDHVRIEQRLFDGALRAEHGALRPDRSRPGLGLELKRRDAARYAA